MNVGMVWLCKTKIRIKSKITFHRHGQLYNLHKKKKDLRWYKKRFDNLSYKLQKKKWLTKGKNKESNCIIKRRIKTKKKKKSKQKTQKVCLKKKT